MLKVLLIDNSPISGQTKDTGMYNYKNYVVLKMESTDAPSFLTLTYPGLIFGHGFSTTGMSVYRNSLGLFDKFNNNGID